MKNISPLTRDQLIGQIIPSLEKAVKRPELLGAKHYKTLALIEAIARSLSTDGVTTVGATIHNVIYRDRPLPRNPGSTVVTLQRARNDINALLLTAQAGISCCVDTANQYGSDRRLYFEQIKSPEATIEEPLSQPMVLSKELATSALAQTLQHFPTGAVLPVKILRHVFSVISELDPDDGTTTTGHILHNMLNVRPDNRKRLAEQMARSKRIMNRVFACSGVAATFVLENNRNAGDNRVLYFAGNLAPDSLRVESHMVPRNCSQARLLFRKFLNHYRG